MIAATFLITEPDSSPTYHKGHGVMSDDEVVKFLTDLSDKLNFCMPMPNDSLHRDIINGIIARESLILNAAGRTMLIADGLRIVGARLAFDQDDRSHPYCVLTSEFYPRARYRHTSDDHIALGFFEQYDLYVNLADPHVRPASMWSYNLIARYGHGPDDVLAVSDDRLPSEYTGHVFAEVMARAEHMRVLG
jgi:hypothetical protein